MKNKEKIFEDFFQSVIKVVLSGVDLKKNNCKKKVKKKRI